MTRFSFNPTQQLFAKYFYALISAMSDEQKHGAVMVLSMLGFLVEDGYISLFEKNENDFYTHCYDTIVSMSLAVKMLKDDGLVDLKIDDIKNLTPEKHLQEAALAFTRIENLIRTMVKDSDILQ